MAKKILLVEDDDDIAALVRLNLQDEGYQIVHEADGARRWCSWKRAAGMRRFLT